MEPLRLHYSEALIRRVVRAYWWRETGWTFSALLALLGIVFTMLLLGGDRSWRVGALGTFLVICALVSAAVYVTHYRASLGRLRRMRVPEATLELGDERVRVTSDFGVAEMEWRAFSGVHRFPDFWLLFLARNEFITLPAADLPDEARSLILARVKDVTR